MQIAGSSSSSSRQMVPMSDKQTPEDISAAAAKMPSERAARAFAHGSARARTSFNVH